MKRVLVTRPEPGALVTAARLKSIGFEPVVMPLSRIVALSAPTSAPGCDAVAVTSANAIRHAPEKLIRNMAGKPCFAVGSKTAVAARSAGFADVVVGQGSAVDLAKAMAFDKAKKIAYLAGRVRLPDFEEALGSAGLSVQTIETYDTEVLEPSDETVQALLQGRPIDAALIYSLKAAEALQRLMKRPDLTETFSRTVHCCLSERIAKYLDGIERQRIRIAERPEEDELLALLPA